VSQPLVLAIEPDLRQAAIVKRIVREKEIADVVVVDSRDAAIAAMRSCMPDVLLLSALLSPRDEDELIAHLRTLDNAGHLQTHTIPQLASTLGGAEDRGSRGLLSAFRRKKTEEAPVAGCDPDMFADEIRLYLQQAADKKNQIQTSAPFVAPARRSEPAAAADSAQAGPDEADAPVSAWASPFEWKPSTPSGRSSRAREDAPARKPAAAPPPAPEPVPEPAIAPLPEPVIVAPILESPSVLKPVEQPVVAMPVQQAAVVDAPIVKPAPAPVLEIEPPSPVNKKAAKPVEAPRPKPVVDRPARISRAQLREMLKAQKPQEGSGRDRLGPVTRWARSDAPRSGKNAAAQADDVRGLISALAVPSSVASIAYARGVRIRRVRVPLSPDQDAAAQASA
jgi:hypothetical protein